MVEHGPLGANAANTGLGGNWSLKVCPPDGVVFLLTPILNVQTDTPDLIIPLMIPLIIRGMFCLLAAISHSLLAHYLMDNSIFAIPVYAHPDGQLNFCDSCLRPSYLIRATPKDSLC